MWYIYVIFICSKNEIESCDAMSHMKYSTRDPLNIAVSRQATPEPKAKAKAKRKAKAKAKAPNWGQRSELDQRWH